MSTKIDIVTCFQIIRKNMRDKILLLLIGFTSFTISYSISCLYFDILTKEEYIMEHLVEEDYGIDEEGEWIVI